VTQTVNAPPAHPATHAPSAARSGSARTRVIAFGNLGVVADPEVGMKLNGTPYTSAYSGSNSPSSSGT